jgi:hypothetical protein
MLNLERKVYLDGLNEQNARAEYHRNRIVTATNTLTYLTNIALHSLPYLYHRKKAACLAMEYEFSMRAEEYLG